METLAFKKVHVPASRFRGVYAFRSNGRFKWQCLLTVDDSRREHLGTFDTEQAAARAFDDRARAVGRASECNFEGPEMTALASRPVSLYSNANSDSVFSRKSCCQGDVGPQPRSSSAFASNPWSTFAASGCRHCTKISIPGQRSEVSVAHTQANLLRTCNAFAPRTFCPQALFAIRVGSHTAN